jgi:LysM repeat protein
MTKSAVCRTSHRVVIVAALLALLWGPASAWVTPQAAHGAELGRDTRAAPEAQGEVYIVQRGDTLTLIAARLGVSPAALAQINGIANPDFIYVGQRLLMPGGGAPAPGVGGVHIVQRGETLTSIAARYGVSVNALAQANGLRSLNFVWVGQRLSVPGAGPAPQPTPAPQPAPAPQPTPAPQPAPQGDTHIVQVGDTLASIAQRYNTTVAALVAANGLPNPNFIWVGQRLKVSAGGAPLPAPPPQPAPAPTAGRWIDINLSRQRLTAYEGQRAVFSALISSGLPRTPTVVGSFSIGVKLTAQTMSGPGYHLPNVPYVMYFYGAYAIHGAYWHSNFGRPMSHGCVNMSTPNAAWLFGWASVGTPVVVHY